MHPHCGPIYHHYIPTISLLYSMTPHDIPVVKSLVRSLNPFGQAKQIQQWGSKAAKSRLQTG